MRDANFKVFTPKVDGSGKVAFDNEVLRVLSGSEVLGTALETGDRDEMGIFIEPPEYVIGFNKLDHYGWRSQPEGKRSRVGDTDLTLYSLRKFMGLALQGNPSIINMLFTPPESVLGSTSFGTEILTMRDQIISKRAAPRFMGYMNSQRKRLEGEITGHMPKRPELIEKFGYDTKYAMHTVRLGMQGIELMQQEKLTLPIMPAPRKVLLDIRAGKYTLPEILQMIDTIEISMKKAVEASLLRDEPDMDLMTEWMVAIHRRYWKWNVDGVYQVPQS